MRSSRMSFLTVFILLGAVALAPVSATRKVGARGEARAEATATAHTSSSRTSRLSAVMLKGLKARSIGPAGMAGRASAIAFDPQDPFTFYIGLGRGRGVE